MTNPAEIDLDGLAEHCKSGNRQWERFDADQDAYISACGVVVASNDLASLIARARRADALAAQAESVRSARDEAIKLMTEYARQAGDAKGRLEMSELAGIVEGWQERTFKTEARVAALEEGLRKIASCESHTKGDVVDIARSLLSKGEG